MTTPVVSPVVSIELEPRTVLGKKVKALRRSGIIPVNLYGAGIESRALQCEERTLLRTLNAAGGEQGGTIQVNISGQPGPIPARASHVQWDPRTGNVLHVDFQTTSD